MGPAGRSEPGWSRAGRGGAGRAGTSALGGLRIGLVIPGPDRSVALRVAGLRFAISCIHSVVCACGSGVNAYAMNSIRLSADAVDSTGSEMGGIRWAGPGEL